MSPMSDEGFDWATCLREHAQENARISRESAVLTTRRESTDETSGGISHEAELLCRDCSLELAKVKWTLYSGNYYWDPDIHFPLHVFYDAQVRAYRRSKRSHRNVQMGRSPRDIRINRNNMFRWKSQPGSGDMLKAYICSANGYVYEEQSDVFDVLCDCGCRNAVLKRTLDSAGPRFEFEPWANDEAQ